MASLKQRTKTAIRQSMTDDVAAKDLISVVDSAGAGSLAGSAGAAPTTTAITYTAGSAPYTADGTLTVANGASVTAVDAFSLALECKRELDAIKVILSARGVTL